MLDLRDYEGSRAYLFELRPYLEHLTRSEHAAVRYATGRLAHAFGRLARAVQDFGSAIELDDDEPEYRAALTRALIDHGDRQRAEQVAGEGVSKFPEYEPLRQLERILR